MKRILLILAFSSVPAGAQAQPVVEPSVEQARMRVAELGREVADRATPDRALRSYFQHFNNRAEISCLVKAIERGETGPVSGQLEKENNAVRDSFFTDFPARTLHKYDDHSYATCMAERESIAYEITGVEPIGSTQSRITLVARNTTPLTPAMKPSEFDLKSRSEGTRYRFSFVKQGQAWKIDQIEQWPFYAEEWQKEFVPSSLDPLVPTLVRVEAPF